MSNQVPVQIKKHGDAKNICKRFKIDGNVLELKKFDNTCPDKNYNYFCNTTNEYINLF